MGRVSTAKLHAKLATMKKDATENVIRYYGEFVRLLRRADPTGRYYTKQQKTDMFVRSLDHKL